MATTHNFEAAILTVGGVRIAGFGDGGGIEFTHGPRLTRTSGADGALTFSVNADRAVGVKITLKQTSPSIKVLEAFMKASTPSPLGIVLPHAFAFIDAINGTSYAGLAYFESMESFVFNKDAGDVVFNMVLENGRDTAVHAALTFG